MNRLDKAVIKRKEYFVREESETEIMGNIVASTRGTTSLAARAFYYDGEMQKGVYVGEYLKRKNDGKTYMINTVQVRNGRKLFDRVFMTQCNQIVTLARPKPAGIGQTSFEVYAVNIPIFKDTTTRSLSQSKDGLVPQDITIIHIPRRYGIKKLDRVYIVREDVALDDKDSEFYQVDSMNSALVPLFDWVDFSGVEVMQLSDDVRENTLVDSGDTGGGEEPDEPDEPTEPENPGGWW